MLSIFSYTFPFLCLPEEVSDQTLFLKGYWLLFVEIEFCVYFKTSPLSDM